MARMLYITVNIGFEVVESIPDIEWDDSILLEYRKIALWDALAEVHLARDRGMLACVADPMYARKLARILELDGLECRPGAVSLADPDNRPMILVVRPGRRNDDAEFWLVKLYQIYKACHNLPGGKCDDD